MTYDEEKEQERREVRDKVVSLMRTTSTALLAALAERGATLERVFDRTMDDHRPHFTIYEVNGEHTPIEMKPETTRVARVQQLNGKMFISVGAHGFQRRFNQRKGGFPVQEIADYVIKEASERQAARARQAEFDRRSEALDVVVEDLRRQEVEFLGARLSIERTHGLIRIAVNFTDPDAARAFVAIAREAKAE